MAQYPFFSKETIVSDGIGIVRDSFEPEHERPNVSMDELATLGYLKDPSGWVF
ncbi:hypothetical protein BJX63DRAFT_396588 [Aspergillus granulosus]|uniref:Uncharacterized protein n=1 Tax=Aspergillus granulosus TaxID=176169 RepID=A0ABR4HAQ1_9EURO